MTKRVILALVILGLVAICVYIGYIGIVEPPVTPPVTTEPPTTEVPTTEAPPTEIPTTEVPPTIPPVVFPTPERPAIPVDLKPSLPFSQPLSDIRARDLGTAVGFSFPSNLPFSTEQIALKVAALKKIAPAPDGLTLVGMVEVGGAGQFEPGIFEVRIDLKSTESLVQGELAPVRFGNPQPIMFRRIPQILNPERFNSPYEEFTNLEEPPDSAVAISADSLCFVIKTEPSVEQGQEPGYVRFCTESGSRLSVRTAFETQYAGLAQLMGQVAERFNLQDVVRVDQAISELESPNNLKTCTSKILEGLPETPTAEPVITVSPIAETLTVVPSVKLSPVAETLTAEIPSAAPPTPEAPTPQPAERPRGDCNSDITLAPVTRAYFDEQLKQHSPPATPTGTGNLFSFTAFSVPALQEEEAFAIEVGVVQVHKTISTSLGDVLPGIYRLLYYFKGKDENGDDLFLAATISGFKLDEQGNEIGEVVDQPVPAVPSTFVDDPNVTVVEEEADAQISASRMFRRCTFFQRTCT